MFNILLLLIQIIFGFYVVMLFRALLPRYRLDYLLVAFWGFIVLTSTILIYTYLLLN